MTKEPIYSGKALLGYRDIGFPKKGQFTYNLNIQQLRELERIIKHRHGPIIPETDDAIIYAEVAAIMHLIIDREGIENSFPNWCHRWMPWAEKQLIDKLLYEELQQHYVMPSADALGRMLKLSYAERSDLNIRAIRCYDVTREECDKLQATKRREKDRARKKLKRRSEGVKPRPEYVTHSASRQQPWIKEGISRSTWYRRKH